MERSIIWTPGHDWEFSGFPGLRPWSAIVSVAGMRNFVWLIPLVFGAVVVGCTAGAGAGAGSGEMGDIVDDGSVGGISEVPNPTSQMAKASGTPLDELQQGHSIYMLQCGQCHNYMIPKDLFEDEWEDAMPKMIRHAGLQLEDEKAVLAYVLAVKKVEG